MTEYLSFGKSERIAIVSVILLIILLIFLPSLYKSLLKPLQTMDTSFEAEITAFLSQEDNMAGTDPKNFDYSNPDRAVFRSGITPFIFDPNTLEKKDWIKMGFTEKQASGIVRYREKGGMFRKKEDLKKLYAVTEDVYCILEPFISIKSNNLFLIMHPRMAQRRFFQPKHILSDIRQNLTVQILPNLLKYMALVRQPPGE
ncbi:MAG: helix-hairpin-helix domain-containing protein [Bacteroidales bacterium]|nr:helix-hairpin-helix domain-containing protein [Bacteroidales bacterium]